MCPVLSCACACAPVCTVCVLLLFVCYVRAVTLAWWMTYLESSRPQRGCMIRQKYPRTAPLAVGIFFLFVLLESCFFSCEI